MIIPEIAVERVELVGERQLVLGRILAERKLGFNGGSLGCGSTGCGDQGRCASVMHCGNGDTLESKLKQYSFSWFELVIAKILHGKRS
jgi:hypothetical protein